MLNNLNALPPDPIFDMLTRYQADPNPQKVNLGIGIYATENGESFVPASVQTVFNEVDATNFDYQPIRGMRAYLNAVAELVLPEFDLNKLALQATCGGTQACSMFGDLMTKDQVKRKMLIGEPTWGNHYAVFKGLEIIKFDHLGEDGRVNFAGYQEAIANAETGSILLLHGGLTHNPTGRNLSLTELAELIPAIRSKEMVVFVDAAYLGFGDGMEDDAEFVRILFKELDNVACGISFSKNAALYEHRTGLLMIKTDRKEVIESQLAQLSRESISMVPGIGQEMMLNILTNKKDQWLAEVEEMRLSIMKRRDLLIEKLPENFVMLSECRGMFGFVPLSGEQLERLRKEYGIYILDNTRVNFGGIKISDIDYLAEAIKAVI